MSHRGFHASPMMNASMASNSPRTHPSSPAALQFIVGPERRTVRGRRIVMAARNNNLRHARYHDRSDDSATAFREFRVRATRRWRGWGGAREAEGAPFPPPLPWLDADRTLLPPSSALLVSLYSTPALLVSADPLARFALAPCSLRVRPAPLMRGCSPCSVPGDASSLLLQARGPSFELVVCFHCLSLAPFSPSLRALGRPPLGAAPGERDRMEIPVGEKGRLG